MNTETPFIAVMADQQKHMLISEIDLINCGTGPIRVCDVPNLVSEDSCAIPILFGSKEKAE